MDIGTDTRPLVLLVEDELNLARPLRFNLEQEGYSVRATASGREALQWLTSEPFDLLILDIMIEEMDGFEVARRVRQRDQRLPILMLTARTAEADRVRGLELGADDYLVKPFHLRELLLRVRRMLQRRRWYAGDAGPERLIEVAGHAVNLDHLTAKGPHGNLQLTELEGRLLDVLTSEPERVFSRAELLQKVWGYRSDVESRTVDNFIVRLRKYFEPEPEHPRHFLSVRGQGYVYRRQ
jgi:DNA-binding response OmpR family regulator